MKKVKNVIVVSAVFPPEPVVSAKLSLDLADEFSKDFNVTVLSPFPTRPSGMKFTENYVSNESFSHIYIESYTSPNPSIVGRLYESYSFGKKVVEYLNSRQNKLDAIYLNSWPLFSQGLVVSWARKNKVKAIIHVQDIYPESFTSQLPKFLGFAVNAIFKKYDSYILKNANHIIAISQNMKDYLSRTRNLDLNKFVVVRNWQSEIRDIKEIRESILYKHSLLTFMYLGSINKSSGVDFLIRVFCELNLENVRLIIAGNGSEKVKCEELASSFPNCKIEFCDASPEQVYELQSIADVMMMPLKKGISLTATPSKLLAYLFSAKPVLACIESSSDAAQIIKNSNCGWVTNSEDSDSLKTTLLEVFHCDKQVLRRFGLNGYEYAQTNFSKSNNIDKIVRLINSN